MGENDSQSSKQSFWTTLPGIITAISGVILAVATLVTAMGGAGLFANQTNQNPAITTTVQTSPVVTTVQPVTTVATIAPVLSFNIVPSSQYAGDEISIYPDNQVKPDSIGMIYWDNHPLAKKVFTDYIVVAIPGEARDYGILNITTTDGQSAEKKVIVLKHTMTPTPTSSSQHRAPPAP